MVFSISDFDWSVSAELEQERQALSCVEEWNSAILSHCSWGDRTLDKLYLEPTAFWRKQLGCECCDFILRVTFEEVP